jgi:hypothetical protein
MEPGEGERMTISEDVLIERMESSFNIIPELPGRLDLLDIPGVQGRVTNVSHPLANVVSAARLDEENADRTINEILELFDAREQAFGWVVGPASTPSDLGERLEAHSIPKASQMAGLVLTDLRTPIRSNPEVEVREVTGDELPGLTPLVAESFGIPANVSDLFFDALRFNSNKVRSRTYVASIGGQPVSWALMNYLPGEPIVQLGGASTLAEHRGNGVYTTLVARRLADAEADGMTAALIQAVQDTSAPICRKIGFREIGVLDFHVHMPNGGLEADQGGH